MMLQIGISDHGLQPELGSTREPTEMKKMRDMSRPARRHILLLSVTLPREVLPHVALPIRAVAMLVLIFPVAGGNGAGVSLCAANVFAAKRAIT